MAAARRRVALKERNDWAVFNAERFIVLHKLNRERNMPCLNKRRADLHPEATRLRHVKRFATS